MNRKLKRYNDFISEMNQEDDFLADDEYNNPNPVDPFDDSNPDIQDEYPDIEDEEKENMVQVIYDKDSDDFFIDSELDEPINYEDFNDWFLSIDESETSVSMTENEEKGEIVYHLPEYLYIEYLEKEKEIQNEEGTEDEIGIDDEMGDEGIDDEFEL
jgi:hypothetical protein